MNERDPSLGVYQNQQRKTEQPRSYAPATVGMKKGAALGAVGGSTGLFRSLINASCDRFAHCDLGTADSVTSVVESGGISRSGSTSSVDVVARGRTDT